MSIGSKKPTAKKNTSVKDRPTKPYPDFPLYIHPNGQWCKKIKGRTFYFGKESDKALTLWLEQRDDLYAGRAPKVQSLDGPTLGQAMDRFLTSKKLAEQAGELSGRTYREYEATCDRIAAVISKKRPLKHIDETDLFKLRTALSKGKTKDRSPTTVRSDLTRARMVFLYTNEYVAEKAIPYRKALKSPSQRTFRKLANERGPRMFEAEAIKALIASAENPQLKAMIYLGINCGFGPGDCGTLPLDKVKNGWHSYWRPKTHNPRRCPLWPETIKAIEEAIESRPENITPDAKNLVFVTRYGNAWADAEEEGRNAISYEFRKLLLDLGMYRKNVTSFYNLRRTFETIGASCGEQVAVDFIMGHVAPNDDMASIYRQKVFNAPLLKVVNHVHDWFTGLLKIE